MFDFVGAYQFMMNSPNLKSAIGTIVLAIFAEILRRVFTPKGRVVWAVSHQHHFILPAQPQHINVRIRDIWIQNIGRDVSKNMQVVINFPPQHYDIWPPMNFTQAELPDGRLVVTLDSLAVREFVQISFFESRANMELPDIVNVRSDDGVAKKIVMAPRQIFPQHINAIILIVLVAGLLSIIFGVLRVLIGFFS